MMDHVGRIVGTGISRPIMITDDHKTASANNRQADYVNTFSGTEPDWPQVSPVASDVLPSDLRGPSRRKDKIVGGFAKKRPKPYDSSTKPGRGSREGSVSSLPSPSTTYSPLPVTRSPTPSSVLQNLLAASEAIAHVQSQSQTPSVPALQPSLQSSDTSSPDILSTPLDHNSDVHMPEINPQVEQSSVSLPQIHQSLPSPPILQQPQPQIPSPLVQPTPAMMLSQAQGAASMPFLFFEPNQSNQNLTAMQIPTIHRLIPNIGPTFGGIEVTVLGANFHANLNLRCIFGEAVASSTQRWSDNTLVCVLPPRPQPGVVAVWFEGMVEHPSTPPSLFTYSDESDRALCAFLFLFSLHKLWADELITHCRMELALQVVGLKMTGKIEDAKNVAMRIVGGNTGNDSSDSCGNTSNLMQLASSSAVPTTLTRDLRSLLFIRAGENENFENTVVDFLSILDTPLEVGFAPSAIPTAEAISYPTATGQTLLHLAAFMKLPALVQFLVKHDADIDARDRNGFTPLHFAALARTEECARILVLAGADGEIVNSLGKTAEEIATPGFFDSIIPIGREDRGECDDGEDGDVESEIENEEDEEAEWGDVEEDGGDEVKVRRLLRKRGSKRSMKKSGMASANTSGRGTPRRSADISRAATPPAPLPSSEKKPDSPKSSKKPDDLASIPPSSNEKADVDVKQTASFVEVIQRTFAQLPPAAGIIPNLPNLPNLPKPQLPGFPNLSDFGSMPWNSLPQIPMVFPVFVPTPAWPSFLGGSDDSGTEKGDTAGVKRSKTGEDSVNTGEAKAPNAGEWKAVWERWLALAIATTARQQQQQGQVQEIEDIPPPKYTPRAEDVTTDGDSLKGKGKAKASSHIPTANTAHEREVESLREAPVATSTPGSSRPHSHPVGYDDTPVPAEEVEAYTYQPPVKQKQKHKKREPLPLHPTY